MRLSGLPSYSEAPKQPHVEAETGSISLRRPLKNFLSLVSCSRCVRTWKYGALFLHGLVPGSSVSVVWVLLVEYRELDPMGYAVVLWRALLGSILATCSV